MYNLTKEQEAALRKRLLEQQAGVPTVRVVLVDPHQRAPLFIATKGPVPHG